jgi:multiple sugar transport system ATP-binding protein
MGSPVMNLVPATVDGLKLGLPFGDVRLSIEQADRIGERELVVVGIRPEHCFDASKAESYRLARPIEFEGRVDDVEWGGKTQSVFLGYEIDSEVEEQLTAIEVDFEFDLFQNFLVAQLSTDAPAEVGSDIRLAVGSDSLYFFDLETAEAI